jgi:hypothetical protein
VPLVMLRRVLINVSGTIRRWDRALAQQLEALSLRLSLTEASYAAAYVLLLTAVALGLALWYFFPLVAAMFGFVSNAPADDLAVLASDQVALHNSYRWAFSLIVIATVAMWCPVLRLTTQGQRLPLVLWACGLALFLSAMALLHAPYRLVNYRTTYEVVQWRDTRCFVTGASAEALLLFCPEQAERRTRVVGRDDPGLVRLRETETNLFNRFSATLGENLAS